MADTTEIEKKSLEAHVELCAERYRFLEEKLGSVEEKLSQVVASVADVKAAVNKMSEKSNDRLINWGIGIIVFLVGVIGYLLKSHLQ